MKIEGLQGDLIFTESLAFSSNSYRSLIFSNFSQKMLFLILSLNLFSLFVKTSVGDVVEGGISVAVKPDASCQFSIHEKGPDGKELTGKVLYIELK